MGYYTKFTLEILDGKDSSVDYESEISEFSGYDWCFEGEIKWYGWDDDMKGYSKKHPNVTFSILGEGEESGDLWVAYFKNGKMHFAAAEITYEDFDEKKLK
jgi:hypothetical protein